MSEAKSVRIEKYHFARNSEMLNHPKSEGQRERILATGDWTVSLVAAGEGLQAAGRPTEEKQSVNKQADKERTTGTTNPRSSSLLWLAKPNWELDHFPSKKMLKMAGRRSGGAGRRHPSVYPFHSSAYSLIRCLDLSIIDHLHLVMECRSACLILWFSGLDYMQLTVGTWMAVT